MKYRRTKWYEIALLLGYKSERVARRMYDEATEAGTPMPIVIENKTPYIDDVAFEHWQAKRFDRLIESQLKVGAQ